MLTCCILVAQLVTRLRPDPKTRHPSHILVIKLAVVEPVGREPEKKDPYFMEGALPNFSNKLAAR
jgi:hypothetical protein